MIEKKDKYLILEKFRCILLNNMMKNLQKSESIIVIFNIDDDIMLRLYKNYSIPIIINKKIA